MLLNSNKEYNTSEPTDFIAGIGGEIQLNGSHNFDNLKNKCDSTWQFLSLSYDLKNTIEKIESGNSDGIKFPALTLYTPRYILIKKNNQISFGYQPKLDTLQDVKAIIDGLQAVAVIKAPISIPITIKARQTKEEYIQAIEKIKQHIAKGDIYELNYCTEFYAENAEINPIELYLKLNEITQTPFSGFYKNKNNYLLTASPERFMAKRGQQLLSQPIKGTAKRGQSADEDEQLKQALLTNEKERAENIMIVDLVRNDLSRSAKKGTVAVDELCGLYTFKQVHQLISSVSATLKDDIHFTDAIKHAFPMGSMTGAPKIRAMQLIEQYEKTKRGLYSGAIGYITPEGDFDLNVVIRSILYNQSTKYVSFMVGSAITINSNPEAEYEECLLKAKAMREVLS